MEITLNGVTKHYNRSWVSKFAVARPELLGGVYSYYDYDDDTVCFASKEALPDKIYIDRDLGSFAVPIPELREWFHALRRAPAGANYFDLMQLITDHVIATTKSHCRSGTNKNSSHCYVVYHFDGVYVYYFNSKGVWSRRPLSEGLSNLSVWNGFKNTESELAQYADFKYPYGKLSKHASAYGTLSLGDTLEDFNDKMVLTAEFTSLPIRYRFSIKWSDWCWRGIFSGAYEVTFSRKRLKHTTASAVSVDLELYKTESMLGFTDAIIKMCCAQVISYATELLSADTEYKTSYAHLGIPTYTSVKNTKTLFTVCFTLNKSAN